MIPKDRRKNEKRLSGKGGRARVKDHGVDAKKSHAEATLDLKNADFELLASEKRAAFTPLRSRMVAWARRIAGRLSELGIEVEATWTDEEHIDVREQKPGGKMGTASIVFHAPVRKNAILALRLRPKVVEVSVEIYPSVHARAVQGEIVRLFDALPDQFSLGKIEDLNRIPTPEANADDVRALLEGDAGLWLGWSVPREVVLKHAALVGEQLGDAVIALSTVFAVVTDIAPPSRNIGSLVVAAPRAGAARANVLEKGSRVRVLSGPFVGKTGVIQELDARGAKVMLGLLATRLDLSELALFKEGPNRPILSSSHRRPLGARER
ncbi:KOW motif-containing protein [Pendulispora rubella]|uniref:KOW motif-containing protein n=1 Tax=Pendulispora rubella TaxID=2741070 RepID=A0ABZ2KXX7_9BACT